MTLLDGQYSYRGLVFGVGTVFGLRGIEGLEDLEMRVGDQALPRGHGSVPGPYYAAAKDVVFELVVTGGGSASTLAARLAELRMAFRVAGEVAPRELAWKRAGRPERFVRAAPAGLVGAETFETFDRSAFPRVALTAADPRIYSTEVRLVTLSKYDPGGTVLDYPEDYPKDFAGGGGEVVVVNDGSSDAYPLVRFYGPTDGGTVTSVTLRNVTTGQVQTVATSVAAGQILTVDNEAHVTGSGKRVVDLAGSSRYGDWQQPRVPFAVPPGESVLRYETAGTSVETKCVVTWRDTWLP